MTHVFTDMDVSANTLRPPNEGREQGLTKSLLDRREMRMVVGARPWLTRAKRTLAVAVVLGAASVALAKDSGPPSIDIEKLCRGDVDAMLEVFTTGDAQGVDTCVSDERTAREELAKNWASYPGRAKETCIRPRGYLPGYIEWQTCIEMNLGAIELRKREAVAPSTTGSGATRRPSRRRADAAGANARDRECPIVKLREDGLVDYVIAC
jgi:hypothetical protein